VLEEEVASVQQALSRCSKKWHERAAEYEHQVNYLKLAILTVVGIFSMLFFHNFVIVNSIQ
jgi:hypothetical protein